jgi:hypothetical protein
MDAHVPLQPIFPSGDSRNLEVGFLLILLIVRHSDREPVQSCCSLLFATYFKMDLGATLLLGLDTTLAVILVLDCADSSFVFFLFPHIS